ncbi:MAG TPA: protein-L-isoaspartate(D-aspartate) O-methyltransferase [Polyangia bacterium]|nr:protein-L-isoaspartate(D-aspartate) O-methyltransferase [Polyangia bacterium]
MTSVETRREQMVSEQLVARGIHDPRVLGAMGKVPRDRFVDEAMRERAYDDAPLPIGFGQTISQPYMVARMCELARLGGRERVLEIGAGSGYQTAILCELARSVYAVEVRGELGYKAERRLALLGYRNVEIGVFDGTYGWSERAPFDAIIVAAGAPAIPPLLVAQLEDGGRLVIPVGPRQGQRLAIVTRRGAEFDTEWTTPCTFVDLVGKYGWGGDGPPRA